MKKTIRRKTKDFSLISPVASKLARQTGISQDELAPIWNDYIRQYVGTLMKYPTPTSGVYLHKDRIWLTQQYQELAQYDLYDEVEQDPQIAALLQTRKVAVAGLDWDITPFKTFTRDEKGKKKALVSPEDQKLADIIQDKVSRIPNFTQDSVQLLDALGKGFAVSEVIWGVDSDGWVVPVDIQNRPQRRFQFDAYSMTPKVRTINNPFYGDPLPDECFIVHRNSAKYENPFGDPLIAKIYWMWFFKRNIWKFWTTHAQSGASPMPYIKLPKLADDIMKSEALNFIKAVRSGSSGYILDTMELAWAEVSNVLQSSETFDKAIGKMDEQMTKCILGQTLTTEGGGGSSGGGSGRALGQVHQTVRQDILEYDAKGLAETYNSTLVKWLVDKNSASMAKFHYPEFSFSLNAKQDMVLQSTAVRNINTSGAGYMVDPDYIEEEMGIPLSKDAQGNVIIKKPQPSPFQAKPLDENETDSKEPKND